MRINVAVPEAHVSPEVLDAALEATTRLNENMLESGAPLFREAVDRVRWKPEPPGDEHFDHLGVVLGRGWGDCDDLAPWHAASLRVTGEDEGARAVVKKSGPKRWHAIVRRSDGSIDDPSREAGMGQRGVGIMGAGLPRMSASSVVGSYIARPELALRPISDSAGQVEAWQSRGDLPWHWLPGSSPNDIAMAALHASPLPDQAVVGACHGLIDLGEANDVPDDVLDRAAAIAEMCSGADWHDVADEYGPEHATAASHIVGSFFGSLGKIAKAAISPMKLASKAVRHIPGFGGIAAKAMNTLDPVQFAMKHPELAMSVIPGVGPAAAAMASPFLRKLMASGRHLPPRQYAPRGMSTYGTPLHLQCTVMR